MKPICLTIAGADPCSGAGIQADIRTFDRCGVYPFSVITAITYQTAKEFHGYTAISDKALIKQFNVILEAYPIKFIKIGMIPNIQLLKIIINYIKKYDLKAIFDPITISSAGKRLATEGLEIEIEKHLLPNVIIIAPNIHEAEIYSGKLFNKDSLHYFEDLKEAATSILKKMYSSGDLMRPINEEKAVIIKSYEINDNKIADLLLLNKKIGNHFIQEFKIFEKEKILTRGNVHGTGCVFSSAITAFLAKNNSIEDAIKLTENFFDEKFQNFIELPDQGKVIDFTISEEKLAVINQIKEIYNLISNIKEFTKLIPEVRMNISGALPNASKKEDIAGIEGRITIVNNFPKAAGEIKFGVSDHTARLILSAKKFDNSINFAMNLKYNPNLIKLIQEKTDLESCEFIRESQPESIRKKEHSTMQWLIENSFNKTGKIPDIIWDNGSIGKEPIIRLFGRNSKEMILKLKKIVNLIRNNQ